MLPCEEEFFDIQQTLQHEYKTDKYLEWTKIALVFFVGTLIGMLFIIYKPF